MNNLSKLCLTVAVGPFLASQAFGDGLSISSFAPVGTENLNQSYFFDKVSFEEGDDDILQEFIDMRANSTIVAQRAKSLEPLVKIDRNGQFKLSKRHDEVRQDMLKMNDLSYALVRKNDKALAYSVKLQEELEKNGWKINGFFAVSGGYNRDMAGLVGYNKKLNQILIVFRGSGNDGDWATNLDGLVPVEATSLGLDLPGFGVHPGFGKKYVSSVKSYMSQIHYFLSGLSETEKEKLGITISGHSQGAALAQIALTDFLTHEAEEIFGKGYRNNVRNQVTGYVFSAPQPFAKDSVAEINNLIGEQNLVVQNVHYDPVTHVPFGGFNIWNGFGRLGTLALDEKDVAANRKEVDRTIEKIIVSRLAPYHYGNIYNDNGSSGASFGKELPGNKPEAEIMLQNADKQRSERANDARSNGGWLKRLTFGYF